jgi:hypothetical protein
MPAYPVAQPPDLGDQRVSIEFQQILVHAFPQKAKVSLRAVRRNLIHRKLVPDRGVVIRAVRFRSGQTVPR